ncbi:MAG: hypothetical protein MJZ76_10955 [Bacteroidales bacterium]|nr:hypothetical protein [Bacteroidales bacterium]
MRKLLMDNGRVLYFDSIQSWWQVIKPISEFLFQKKAKEVIVINGNSEAFSSLRNEIGFLKYVNLNDGEDAKFLIALNQEKQFIDSYLVIIGKVVENNTDFDKDINKEGLLRLQNNK